MLAMLRDEKAEEAQRMWAAERAAPYIHPKLASTELTGNLTISHEDRLGELE
jgi:hypothetical protein